MDGDKSAYQFAERVIDEDDISIDIRTTAHYVAFARVSGADDRGIREALNKIDAMKESIDSAHADRVGIIADDIPEEVLPDSER